MNIIEAAQALKEGKKIRQLHWEGLYLWSDDKGIYRGDDNSIYEFWNFNLLLDEKWEVVEEDLITISISGWDIKGAVRNLSPEDIKRLEECAKGAIQRAVKMWQESNNKQVSQ